MDFPGDFGAVPQSRFVAPGHVSMIDMRNCKKTRYNGTTQPKSSVIFTCEFFVKFSTKHVLY